MTKIVVLGSGFAGLEATFYLRHRLGAKADITVVSESDQFHFKPNTIYIPFGKPAERFVFPMQKVLDGRGVGFTQATATAIDPDKQVVSTTSGDVEFDYLLIATGAGMRASEVPGLREHGVSIWTPSDMLELGKRFEALLADAKLGRDRRVLFLVPPNNKCSGPLYEMVFMLETHLRRNDARGRVTIDYASCEHSYIQAFGPRLHETVVREFKERGITGHLERKVKYVEPDRVLFEDDSSMPFDLLVSFPPYIASTTFDGLPHDDRGFLETTFLSRQVAGYRNIYAIGDAGDFPVKQAFLALLQADAAAEHLSERLLGEQVTAAFDPVSMCIMEQFDRATFAQVPLKTTGDPDRPVIVREHDVNLYKVGTGSIWRVGKKLLGTALPHAFKTGRPFHAGPSWSAMEAGLGVMSSLFAS